jgi:uncharacterized protein (TIGR02594 family)
MIVQVMTSGSIDRRAITLGGLSILTLPSVSVPAAARASRPVDDYRDFESAKLPPPLVGGTQVPLVDETDIAGMILSASPKTSPLVVMRYFERLKKRNRDGEAYNGGWRTRWNPVIVAFFRETATTPQGDSTSWCAASLNWALARAGYQGGTGSASSGSFREAPGRTNRPRPGDIVVFGRTDPQAFQAGQGHVGLFLAQCHDAVLVLGGNQANRFGHHTFCRKWLAKKGTDLKLHSFHAIHNFKQPAA